VNERLYCYIRMSKVVYISIHLEIAEKLRVYPAISMLSTLFFYYSFYENGCYYCCAFLKRRINL